MKEPRAVGSVMPPHLIGRRGGFCILRKGLFLLAVLALAFPASASAAEPFAPSAAVAYKAPTGNALVAWIPGEELAESYKVYGLSGEPVFLGQVNLSQGSEAVSGLLVPGNYASYAVSGVKAGVESEMVLAILAEEDCVVVDPPDVIVRCVPIVKVSALVKIRRPV